MKIWIAAICVGLIGCSEAHFHAQDVDDVAHEASLLVYFKDARTGLCFAGRGFGHPWGVVTNVPCSAEVEKAIAGQGQTASPRPESPPPGTVTSGS
jgi:hypothetical protein